MSAYTRLEPNMRAFVDALSVGATRAEAARAAGSRAQHENGLMVAAWRWLQREDVQAALDEIAGPVREAVAAAQAQCRDAIVAASVEPPPLPTARIEALRAAIMGRAEALATLSEIARESSRDGDRIRAIEVLERMGQLDSLIDVEGDSEPIDVDEATRLLRAVQ